jgi:uncharacterized protein (TIGR03086 family)
VTADRAVGPLSDAAGLLERALSYVLGAVSAIPPGCLSRPTPCRAWDLRALLWHLDESLTTLQEGIDTGRIALESTVDEPAAADPVAAVRGRVCRLRGAWTAPVAHRVIAIADRPLETTVVAGAGALEIAVHGWDISQACGQRQPIPRGLSLDLLTIAAVLVTGADRRPAFGPSAPVAAPGGPSERLVAFLGREPLPVRTGR